MPTEKTQHLRQENRYQSGTISFKDITIKHEVKHTEGYLERMGLVSILHGKDQWYMKIHNAVLVPQLVRIAPQSIENLYISPISSGENVEGVNREASRASSSREQNNNNSLAYIYKTGSVGRKDGTLPLEVS